MDTTLWPYRLKTARQKKRLLRKDRDKQLLRLERQYKELEQQQKAQPTILLDEPYQRGWVRKFVLRADIQKGKQASFYQQILDVINEEQYHYDASFKQPKCKGRWHRYYYDRLPQLRVISSTNWQTNRYKLTEEQRECFEPVKYWNDTCYMWDYQYRFTQPQMFEVAVLPRMVYEIQLPDGELETRIAFAEDQLYAPPAIYRHAKITGGWYKNWYFKYHEKKKYTHPFQNKPLHEIFYRNFFDI